MNSSSSKEYPSSDQCLELIKKYEMFPNIINHSIQVKNVTEALYKHIIDRDKLNFDLLIAAALLHDIAKTNSIINKDLRHDLTGGKMLRELGYDDIAVIVENHVVFTNFNPDGPLEEKEIIFYADKRVMHDSIVTIEERVSDLVERYGRTDRIKEMIVHNKKFILELEAKIQRHMDINIEAALKDL